MILSTNTRYAIRLIYELHQVKAPLSITALAERINVSAKVIENVHAELKRHGITDAIIGANGGIRLIRSIEEISLGKMIELFDNGVRFVVCFGNKSNNCPRQSVCETQSVWKTISNRIQNELDSISLADILDEYRQGASREQPIKIHCINHKGDLTF
ncbi:MAG: Rrf2 family transcriptional regulator [Oxalobacter sp.]|nr:Rrf2 family transcriptional regulator [Oxalobacter sp.]